MPREITNNEFENEVIKSDKLVLVDFFATWCPPCKMLAPVLEKISEDRKDFKILKLNTDENIELSINYSIESIPTMIIFKDGIEMDRMIGYTSEEEIIRTVNKYI